MGSCSISWCRTNRRDNDCFHPRRHLVTQGTLPGAAKPPFRYAPLDAACTRSALDDDDFRSSIRLDPFRAFLIQHRRTFSPLPRSRAAWATDTPASRISRIASSSKSRLSCRRPIRSFDPVEHPKAGVDQIGSSYRFFGKRHLAFLYGPTLRFTWRLYAILVSLGHS